jgi:hypothetical protein
MYEIIFMGIPCRECDVTQEFLDTIQRIKNSNCFAITLTDYPIFDDHSEVKNSVHGHNIIKNNIEFVKSNGNYIKHKINTLGDVWQSNKRDAHNICIFLLNQFDSLYLTESFDAVIILAPGSPNIDILPKTMSNIRPVKIIDIKSPIIIAAEHMGSNYVIRKFNQEFILENNNIIYPKIVNVFYALTDNYSTTDTINLFVEHMKKHLQLSDDIFYAHIGETVDINKISFRDFIQNIEYFHLNSHHLTFGVFKHNV